MFRTPSRPVGRLRSASTGVSFVCACLAAALATEPLLAQRDGESMFVSVVDSTGAPVPGLNTTDFVVEEDGTEREVLRVQPSTAPMQIAILVDTSASLGDATGHLRNGVETLVNRLYADNELALVSFGGTPRILVESTGRLDRLRDGIGQVFSSSDSAAYLLDALVETARGFERREATRPVIIAITGDGVDYSNRDSRQALQALRDSRAAAHVIVLRGSQTRSLDTGPTGFGAAGDHERDLFLARGPRESGGQRHDLVVSARLDQTLQQLAAVLVNQYEVVYSRPARLIPPDSITVRMRRDDLSAQGTPVRRVGG